MARRGLPERFALNKKACLVRRLRQRVPDGLGDDFRGDVLHAMRLRVTAAPVAGEASILKIPTKRIGRFLDFKMSVFMAALNF